MSDSPKTPNRFTAVIDLTTRAQEKAQSEKAAAAYTASGGDLPELSVETLPRPMAEAVRAAGWKELMPVQARAMPFLLERKDLIVQSRTGSGKTGAFLLPLFALLDPSRKEPQALVLTPTRELARQIHAEFERMRGAEAGGLDVALVYGGVNYTEQNRSLREGAQVVIGTPGRILDHLERRTFSLNHLQVLVLDEADEMLSMGFYPAMRELKRYLPAKRQSYMFSATMPPKVRSLAREFLEEPSFLSLSGGQISVEEIEHRYHVVEPMEKDRALVRLIEMENPDSAIIFANTKREVEYLATFLRNYGYDAGEISGDLTQKSREAVMDRVRRGTLRFLVATDVAARGIDISDLSHVFQYDVPQDPEYFVHRSGRTARAGKTGTAISLVTHESERQLRSILSRYAIEAEKLPLPTQEDVEARVSERTTVMLEDRMRDRSNLQRERLSRFVPLVRDLAAEQPELLAMLVDDLYHQLLHRSSDHPEEVVEPVERVPQEERSSAPRHGGRSRRSRPRRPDAE